MPLISIEQVGASSKLSYDNGEILYTWKDGRFFLSANGDEIQSVNFALAVDDPFYKQNFKYSEQTNVYGTSTAVEFLEYLIVNDIFFSDLATSVVSEPEATKITEVGKVLYIAKAKAGSDYADPVWKCSKFDETDKTDQNLKWADSARYSQIATDLTTLTYN